MYPLKTVCSRCLALKLFVSQSQSSRVCLYTLCTCSANHIAHNGRKLIAICFHFNSVENIAFSGAINAWCQFNLNEFKVISKEILRPLFASNVCCNTIESCVCVYVQLNCSSSFVAKFTVKDRKKNFNYKN